MKTLFIHSLYSQGALWLTGEDDVPHTGKCLIHPDSSWGKCYICVEGWLHKFTKAKIDSLRTWVMLAPRLQEKRMKLLCMRPWERKWRRASGREERPGAVWWGGIPLIFNKVANLHTDMGAGDGRDHDGKDFGPSQAMGSGTLAASLQATADAHQEDCSSLLSGLLLLCLPLPPPATHYQFFTSSQSELLKCN